MTIVSRFYRSGLQHLYNALGLLYVISNHVLNGSLMMFV